MTGQICQSCGMPMAATEHFGTNYFLHQSFGPGRPQTKTS
jgi:hypothetical protein